MKNKNTSKNDILALKEALENYNQEIEETLFK